MGVCTSKPHQNVPGKKAPLWLATPARACTFFQTKQSQDVASPTPAKKFFMPPPSPARHIKALLRRTVSPMPSSRGGETDEGTGIDTTFGFSKNLEKNYELGEVIGKGHFGFTCRAKIKKKADTLGGEDVAVKIISKAKMTTAVAIDDVRREVKILKALSGHNNLLHFYDAFEDNENVYMVMELCEGGELLERILSRGGKYTENDAKAVLTQMLNIVAFCHLQGVVHRDLKPENFLFTSKDEFSTLKAIDFGLSDFVKPDEQLNDIVGSAYYVAPEVLKRSYSTEADLWSIGVIAYILLCGSRPFWARTESGIFKAVLKADPNFQHGTWPSLSSEAQDFVKRLLNKDPQKRLTAASALCHPWLKNQIDKKMPLDIQILKLMKAYENASPLRKSSLQALAKTLTGDELGFLKKQFSLLQPSENGSIGLENVKMALSRNATQAMKESCIFDFVASFNVPENRRMDFNEFCAATLSVHQLKTHDQWEQQVRHAYDVFEKDGNRPIVIEELASELGLSTSMPVHVVLHDWIRHTDGKLSLLGFMKLVHGVPSKSSSKPQQ